MRVDMVVANNIHHGSCSILQPSGPNRGFFGYNVVILMMVLGGYLMFRYLDL